MGFIYSSTPPPIPEDVVEQLEMLNFYVDNNMQLIASWNSEADNPFSYSMNAKQELILGVQ